ncbi:MAG: sugar phosphate isomerase/epimerase [Gammaproteobacteria bacterium]|nr:sugar phosphate isomerase/epimerase [Gammaproteobacteria bacterium]
MSENHYAISLDMINRHYSEPNRNRYESKYYWEELYTLIAAAGFRHIEIPFEPVWQFGGRSGVPMTPYSINTKYGNADKYLQLLNAAGIESVSAVSFTPNLFVRNDQLGFYFGATGHFAGQAIEFAAALGANTLVLSPTAYAGRLQHYHPDLAIDDPDFIAQTRTLIEQLASQARESGVTLALRPEYWSLISLPVLMDIIAAAGDAVTLTVNTAHLLLSGQDPSDFIATHSEHIRYIQLTDTPLSQSSPFRLTANPEFPAQHASQVFADVGTGIVPLHSVLNTLKTQGYQGDITLCNSHTRDPMRALLRSRRFINQLTTDRKGA